MLDKIRDTKTQIKAVYINYDGKDKEERAVVRGIADEYKQECIKTIEQMSSHEYLMYIVLKEIDKKENRALRTMMFEVLFGKPNETFMTMIKKSKEPIERIEENEHGAEKYYDFYYERVAV